MERPLKSMLKTIAGIVAASCLFLSGCAGSDGGGSSAITSSSPETSTSTSASPSSTTASSDGKQKLDEIREISETAMQAGDIWTTAVTVTNASIDAMMGENQKPHAGGDDDQYDSSDATTVTLSGTTATVTGDGAEAGDGVVRITQKGTYVFSGEFSGQIQVDTADDGKIRIVLDGATIDSATDAALRVLNADEVVVILADGTTNELSDTNSYAADADGTGAIASKADLTIGGTGTLNVQGNATNAISSSDGLVILDGTINVTSVDDGIRGKDYVVVAGGTISIAAEGDAIQSTNEEDIGRGYFLMTGGDITVTKANKAIDAVTDVMIDGGTIDFTSSGDTVEGAYILLADGSGRITSGDDGLNAAGDGGTPWLAVKGGDWTINAEGDGFDSNGDGNMSGGSLTVYGPTNSGNGAIDVQNGMTISGGTLFAAGAVGMDEAPATDSIQVSIKYQASSTQAAGSEIAIADAQGTTIASYTLEKEAQSFVFSSPKINVDDSYTIMSGGSTLGEAVGGEYTENTMSGGPGGRGR
jgi:hypothetical protein